MNAQSIYENFIKEMEEREQFPSLFLDACQKGDLNLVKNLAKCKFMETYNDEAYAYSFQQTCGLGHMEVVQYLLNHEKFSANKNKEFAIDLAFQVACIEEQFEIVKFLSSFLRQKTSYNEAFLWSCKMGKLNSAKYLITSYKDVADIHFEKDKALLLACSYGHLEVVKYLLTSPEIEEHANIHANDDAALFNAVTENQISIVKYLLSSKELKETANIHVHDDKVFQYAIRNKKYELIKYFIFELNIIKSPTIETHLEQHSDEKVESWFKLRDLNYQLNREIISDSIIKNKPKI